MINHTRIAIVWLFILLPAAVLAGESQKKHRLYLEWGYNKDWYSTSTISFHGASNEEMPYEFTVYDAKAKDEFRADKMVTEPFVAQYSYRIGYIFDATKGWGVEFNYDHAKYVVSKGQTAHATGSIRETSFDKDTLIDEPFLLFEHTNGANFAMINGVREKPVYRNAKGTFQLVHTLKFGAGVVVPKSYILIDRQELDNDFHVAGFIAGGETGIKAFYKEHFYLNVAGKACYADYRNALGLGNGKVSHHFWVFEALLTIGYQFSL